MNMDQLFAVQYAYLIPLLPLIGAVISGFFGAKFLKGQSHWPIWLGVGASAIISFTLLFGTIGQLPAHHGGAEGTVSAVKNFYTWIDAGTFHVNVGYFFDPLTALMLCIVCGIGFLITVFSAGYMVGEKGYFRFFAYLGLFIFMMTNLVMGENLIMLYLGWEGVGLCSYLLIGYYYERPAAREAAKKAFLVNRVGDFGFSLGIMLSFMAFGTVSYFGSGANTHTGLLAMAAHPETLTAFQHHALQWIPFLLMLGAFGKSAQFPLYVWLPDAMEGPTPVSALIHAATMVTAGVYMIVRCGTLFVGNHAAMMTIAAVGAFTALLAATIALRQFDLKKVFAYSTVSQLGFMFVGVGCFAPVAGVFHLMTHAFFKALLFLSSGVVMHAMGGELDMRKMSGLKRVLPWTNVLMLIGCLALSGAPFFAGFFSKDEIVAASWHQSFILGLVMLFTAFLTGYYTFRLYFRVFQGPLLVPTGPADAHGGHATGTETTPEAHASHEAVVTGTAAESGKDEQLIHDPHHGTATGHSTGGHGHGDDHHHNHEPFLMIAPLVVLAIGAALAGYLNFPSVKLAEFLGHSPSIAMSYDLANAQPNASVESEAFGHDQLAVIPEHQHEHSSHYWIMLLSAALAIFAIYCAYLMHLKDRARAEWLAADVPEITSILEHKYWVDEIYQAAIVEPLRAAGRVCYMIDRFIIDGIIWIVGFIPQLSGFALKLTTQRGYLQGYAVTMLFGIAVILILVFT
jgi:NADH-quinone oxidoreductase subunit L